MKYKLIKEYPGSPKLGTLLCYKKLQYCNWDEYYQKVIEKDYEILSFKQNSNIIESVKRLSDGEIFTVGDNVSHKCYPQTKFIISKINNTSLGIKINGNTNIGNNCEILLENTIKHKQPLFTTKDGVDIYLGDESWILHKNSWYLSPKPTIHNNSNYFYAEQSSAHWNFSTKEVAEEYIIMNKPCLSINDISEAMKYHFLKIEIFKEIVKSKIKQSV